MKRTEISFTGIVEPANCKCHQGQFVAIAFIIHPIKGEQQIGHTFFETEALANKHLDGFVMTVAEETIDKMGLRIDEASSINVSHGDDALKDIRRYMAENNPTLH